MKRTLLNTVFALAALAVAGCASESPTGPAGPIGGPSLANVGPGDRNGNGVLCGRRVNDDVVGGIVGGDAGAYAAPAYVFVDDHGGVCPGGFAPMLNP